MSKVNDIIINVCNLNMMHLPERNVLLYFYCALARKPSSGDAANKPSSRPSSGGHEKPAADRKKEPDARERRRKEMMQNQVHRLNV